MATAIWGGITRAASGRLLVCAINSMARRDPEQAANTRSAILMDCAEHDRFLMPVHFAGSSCGHVRHDKEVYAWEELS
jgi:hypothetical protein